jgi:hypothetical protein
MEKKRSIKMSIRSIQVGDWAIIHQGKFSKEFPIVKISNDGILISQSRGDKEVKEASLLQETKEGWQVFGLKQFHWVEFTIARVPETGFFPMEEMNMEVLHRAPLESLVYMCSINTTFVAMCKKEYFWKQRYEYEYGRISPYIT